jgi:hypothetical protein
MNTNLSSRGNRAFVAVVFAELHVMRYTADGPFQSERRMPLSGTSKKNRPIVGDSSWNRGISESSKFTFEIKSANF